MSNIQPQSTASAGTFTGNYLARIQKDEFASGTLTTLAYVTTGGIALKQFINLIYLKFYICRQDPE